MLPPLDDFIATQQKGKPGNPNWKKGGESPNPGGRPKKLEELSASIRDISDELRDRLVEIAHGRVKGQKVADSIAAIKLLYAYGFGNPVQAITGADGEPLRLGVVVLPPEETP